MKMIISVTVALNYEEIKKDQKEYQRLSFFWANIAKNE